MKNNAFQIYLKFKKTWLQFKNNWLFQSTCLQIQHFYKFVLINTFASVIDIL